MIEDENIPTADPEMVIRQYEPLLYKLSGKYRNVLKSFPTIDEDDLIQVGRMVIYKCQSKYDPAQASFMSFIYDRCRSAMRRVIGYQQDGSLPQVSLSLDKPKSDSEDNTMMDRLPDHGPGPEALLIQAEERQQIARVVREAVDRLEDDRQREAVVRIWLDEQPRSNAAEAMGISKGQLNTLDTSARRKLSRDTVLRLYAMPSFSVGVRAFQNSWSSSVEKAVIWLEKHRDSIDSEEAEQAEG
jgi:RNA polymerase sigma factor (sigma-70 family)